MDTNMMRDHLLKFYGKNWAEKIKKMSDKQVVAIYLKFKKEGKIK